MITSVKLAFDFRSTTSLSIIKVDKSGTNHQNLVVLKRNTSLLLIWHLDLFWYKENKKWRFWSAHILKISHFCYFKGTPLLGKLSACTGSRKEPRSNTWPFNRWPYLLKSQKINEGTRVHTSPKSAIFLHFRGHSSHHN